MVSKASSEQSFPKLCLIRVRVDGGTSGSLADQEILLRRWVVSDSKKQSPGRCTLYHLCLAIQKILVYCARPWKTTLSTGFISADPEDAHHRRSVSGEVAEARHNVIKYFLTQAEFAPSSQSI